MKNNTNSVYYDYKKDLHELPDFLKTPKVSEKWIFEINNKLYPMTIISVHDYDFTVRDESGKYLYVQKQKLRYKLTPEKYPEYFI